jgi:glycosyltransferase involved in cell wall biosynthesis
LKIAFVNQPIDTILPPYQSSIGACTYGAACSLARSSEVIVYGIEDRHDDISRSDADSQVSFQLLPSTPADRLLYKARNTYARCMRTCAPVSTSRWFFPDFGRQVAIDLQKQRCDVIHIQHCSQYAPVIRAFNPESKLVLHLHAEWFSQSNPALLARRLRHVDFLTTVSNYITEKTCRDFPQIAGRCETAYNGITASEFRGEKDYQAARQRRQKRILYAGAISPHKGIHVLVDAFKIVANRYPDVHLDIVGLFGSYPVQESFDRNDRTGKESVASFYAQDQGPYLSQLKSRLTPIADKAAFWGMIPRPDLIERYYDADFFVFPPVWNEGFGIPPVEAMAAGIPVVASRSGAVVETVRDHETGFLVEKNDPRGLAEGMLKLLEDDALRENMGRAARRWALEQFTWDHVAESMHKRYAALCKRGSAHDYLPSGESEATRDFQARVCP